MNRRTMIAALAVAGATALVAAPSFAQQSSLMNAKIASEVAPKQSGAMPLPTLQAGAKRAVSTSDSSSSDAAGKTLSLTNAAPALPIK
jgi:hypothetical protein